MNINQTELNKLTKWMSGTDHSSDALFRASISIQEVLDEDNKLFEPAFDALYTACNLAQETADSLNDGAKVENTCETQSAGRSLSAKCYLESCERLFNAIVVAKRTTNTFISELEDLGIC